MRRFDYLSDASAVAWNPAMLGLRQHFDLSVGATFGASNSNFPSSLSSTIGAFAKFGGFGIGYTLNPAVRGSSGEIYGGGGLRILDDVLWGGASARWSIFNTPTQPSFLDYTTGLVAKPLPGLFIAANATTMTQNVYLPREERFSRLTENLVQYTLQAAYSLNSSLTLLASARSHSLTNLNAPSLELGASYSVLDAALVFSANVSVLQPAVRLGFDLNSDIFDVGYALAFPSASTSLQHTLFAHFSSDHVHSLGQIRDKRADAELCRGAVNAEFTQSLPFLRSFSRLNPLLAESFEEQGFIKDSANLFSVIRQRFYTMNPNSTESKLSASEPEKQDSTSHLGLFSALSFSSSKNYRVEVRHIDYSRYPEAVAIVRVSDSLGRTVSSLTTDDISSGISSGIFSDISLTNPNLSIRTAQALDTTISVPVDMVMLIDCSGSMKDKIQEVREKLDAFVRELRESGANARLGGILYGTEILDVVQPTHKYERFEQLLARADATQRDEYTPAALDELVGMKFRPDAERVGIVISDEVMYPNRRPFIREALALRDLWRQRISLSKIIKPCQNNGTATAYLTLGQEYDIAEPLKDALSGIGKATTRLFAVTIAPAPHQAFTTIAGQVQDAHGVALPARITLTDAENPSIVIGPLETASNGTFRQAVPEGRKYRLLAEPLVANGTANKATANSTGILLKILDATKAKRGDTLRQTLVIMTRSRLSGHVRDEYGVMVQADIFVRDMFGNTFPPTSTEQASNGAATGYYSLPLVVGRKYVITAVPTASAVYQPLEYELDTRGFSAGTDFLQNFTVQRILKFVQIEGTVRSEEETTQEGSSVIHADSSIVGQNISNSKTVRLDSVLRQGVQVVVKNQANRELITQSETNAKGQFSVRIPKGVSAEITVEYGGYAPLRRSIFFRKTDTATVRDWAVILQRTAREEHEEIEMKRLLDTMIAIKKAPAKAAVLAQRTVAAEDPTREESSALRRKAEPKIPETEILRISFADTKDVQPLAIEENGKASKRTWQSDLDSLAETLKQELTRLSKVVITGHTDDRAGKDVNRAEGWQRATFVVNELVARGVPASLLIATSQGNSQLLPRKPKESQAAYRARCRRVEVMKIWAVP